MPAPDPALAALALRILVALFLAILFLQSGIDKVTDRKGNLGWLTGHFAKSPLARLVPLMLPAITALEIGAGALSLAGVVEMAVMRTTALAFWGALLSAASIVCLFFGQRMAKEYGGAAVLPPYFLVALVGIFLFGGLR